MAHLDIGYIYFDIISKEDIQSFDGDITGDPSKTIFDKNHSILKWHSETRLNVRL